jgi:hypothetical protein
MLFTNKMLFGSKFLSIKNAYELVSCLSSELPLDIFFDDIININLNLFLCFKITIVKDYLKYS